MEQVGFFIVGKPQSSEMEDIIFSEMRDILNNEEFNKIAFCENEESHDILYTFLNDFKNDELSKLFEKHKVLIHFSDITKDVLKQINVNNGLSSGEFKPLFDEFISENLTIDFILDKINGVGIESLTDFDYRILKA